MSEPAIDLPPMVQFAELEVMTDAQVLALDAQIEEQALKCVQAVLAEPDNADLMACAQWASEARLKIAGEVSRRFQADLADVERLLGDI